MTGSGVSDIRSARADDAAALAELKLATFRETFLDGFAIPYPSADLAIFESETFGPARIRAELADPAHMTWVAEKGGDPGTSGSRLVAYAHVGPCKLPHGAVRPGDMELYQLYVRTAAQGAGFGRRLLDLVLDHLRPAGRPIWLGVWSGNARARSVYRARGFEPVGDYQFRVGAWLDDEVIMRLDPDTK